jgi:four helix bundle protein
METCHWLHVALDCGYVSSTQHELLKAQCEETGRMVAGMIAKSGQFCRAQRPTDD